MKLEQMQQEVEALKKNTKYDDKKDRSLIHIEQMSPTKLSKPEEWRKWKQEVEDYVEEVSPGM